MQVSKWCIVFAGIGAGAIVMGMLQQYGFGCMGQRLTRRLRVLLLQSMFRQVCLYAVLHTPGDTVACCWGYLSVPLNDLCERHSYGGERCS